MGCLAALFAFGLWSWRVRAQGARAAWRGVARRRERPNASVGGSELTALQEVEAAEAWPTVPASG
eukprot:scaffold144100_cov133-Phaeocystis_antarctica.AAC.2